MEILILIQGKGRGSRHQLRRHLLSVICIVLEPGLRACLGTLLSLAQHSMQVDWSAHLTTAE